MRQLYQEQRDVEQYVGQLYVEQLYVEQRCETVQRNMMWGSCG